MKPAPFTYHAPRSVEEAVAVLTRVGADGKVLAGGQSLVPILSMRLASFGHLVDINRVEGLDTIEVRADGVRVGALVRQARLEHSAEAYAGQPVLRHALVHVAHPAIRNRGTVVGSLAHADPAAELPAILALTGGLVEVVGPRGTREVPSADFFRGPLETSLAPDELAVAAHFGRCPDGTGTAFSEIVRRSGDYALAGVAAAVTVTDGVVSDARVSFVSLTPSPAVLDVSELVVGRETGEVDWAPAAEAVSDHVDPETDIHADADYRRLLAGELTRRVLARAAGRGAAGALSPELRGASA